MTREEWEVAVEEAFKACNSAESPENRSEAFWRLERLLMDRYSTNLFQRLLWRLRVPS